MNKVLIPRLIVLPQFDTTKSDCINNQNLFSNSRLIQSSFDTKLYQLGVKKMSNGSLMEYMV